MVASRAPPTGDLARNPGMALTGSPTGKRLVLRPAFNPLQPGPILFSKYTQMINISVVKNTTLQ